MAKPSPEHTLYGDFLHRSRTSLATRPRRLYLVTLLIYIRMNFLTILKLRLTFYSDINLGEVSLSIFWITLDLSEFFYTGRLLSGVLSRL